MMMRGTTCAIVLGGLLAVSGAASAMFAGNEDGSHEIKVVAATDDHKMLAAESVVTIEVK